MPTKIGFLHTGNEESFSQQLAALISGLGAMGYWAGDEGQRPAWYSQVEIVPKWAKDDLDLLNAYADQLLEDDDVEIIVAAGGPESAVVARDKTAKEDKPRPIVFTTVADPIDSELVETLQEPGKNLTGMAGKTSETDVARLERLQRLLKAKHPALKTKKIRVLQRAEGDRPNSDEQYMDLENYVIGKDLQLDKDPVHNITETIGALMLAPSHHGRLVMADSLFNNTRKDVVDAAAKAKQPAIYQWREFVEVGGLMSYGPSIQEAYFTAGVFVGRILKNEDPATMAVAVPTRYELVINRKTAKDLDILSAAQDLLNEADVVIDGTIEVR
jgi:putative ABC transport system substrate-binding protein